MKLLINAYVYFFVYVQTGICIPVRVVVEMSGYESLFCFQALSAVALMAEKAKKIYHVILYHIIYFLSWFWLK